MPIPSHIKRIVDRYLSDEATPEERAILDEWYRSFDDRFVEVHADVDDSLEQLRDRMHLRLVEALNSEDVVPMSARRFSWIRAAAALLLLAGLGLGIRMI